MINACFTRKKRHALTASLRGDGNPVVDVDLCGAFVIISVMANKRTPQPSITGSSDSYFYLPLTISKAASCLQTSLGRDVAPPRLPTRLRRW